MRQFKCFFLALSVFLMASCTNEDFRDQNGEGILRLSLSVSDGIQTRSDVLTDQDRTALLEKCKIRIFDSEKLVRKYLGTAEIPAEGVQLVSGKYTATVEAGDSVAAAFDKTYYKGQQEFVISRGAVTKVDLKANIRNTLVKVVFDTQSLDVVYKDYQVKIGPEGAMLAYTKADAASKTGYYMLSEGVNAFRYVFSATLPEGGEKSYEGVALENLKPSTLYTVHFKYTQNDVQTGGGMFDIVVEEEPLVPVETSVDIYQRPVFTGRHADNSAFDVNQALNLEPGFKNGLHVWVAFSAPATSLSVHCDRFVDWNIGKTEFDMVTVSAAEREELAAKGIVYKERTTTGGGALLGVEFTSALVQKITAQKGVCQIRFSAGDQQGGNRTLDWTINVSDATVQTEPVNMLDVYTSRAVLWARVVKEPVGKLTFQYRKKGTEQWSVADAVREGENLSAALTGLEPGTAYEYTVADGTTPSSVICEFTTETVLQPENAGFEYWSGSSPLLMYGSNQSMWWDTGNHGSAKMSKNVTSNDTQYVHSGKYSAKLSSQFVGFASIGKFAAGNAFAGKYLRTDGTDGVLGWGRPFASRPVALRGYIRYKPVVVDYACEFISKGSMDKGYIFVALGDWAGETDGNEHWPVLVRTKDKHFFDHSQNNPGTIAYGEMTWDNATEGEGLVEFTIPISYWKTDRKPTTLVLVCTASKYGDYFAGGNGSTMWLDDLEFVYE